MVEGRARITDRMIARQQLVVRTETSRLDLMIGLLKPAGNAPEGVSTRPDLTRLGPAEPAAQAEPLESTSPQSPDKGSVDAAQRLALKPGLRILFDDQAEVHGQIAGSSPAKYPSIFLTNDSNDLPPQKRLNLPGIRRFLAFLGLKVERGRVGDGCPVCGRRG